MRIDLSAIIETESQAKIVAIALELFMQEREIKSIPIINHADTPWEFEHPSFNPHDAEVFMTWCDDRVRGLLLTVDHSGSKPNHT